MVRSGAAPLIVYAFRRVRRSRSTEGATCEAPVHGEALEARNLMGGQLSALGWARSAETLRDAVQTCVAGRAGTYLRSEPAHRTCPSGRADADQAERVPTDFMMKLTKSVVIFRSHFPGGSSHGFQEKSLARNRKTNIVHAPPRLAE
jgi:hypothetical protein